MHWVTPFFPCPILTYSTRLVERKEYRMKLTTKLSHLHYLVVKETFLHAYFVCMYVETNEHVIGAESSSTGLE